MKKKNAIRTNHLLERKGERGRIKFLFTILWMSNANTSSASLDDNAKVTIVHKKIYILNTFPPFATQTTYSFCCNYKFFSGESINDGN